jgi:dephospho-CoA kinase
VDLLKVGLTGGIGSGKSAVGAMLVSLGAHLVQADQIAHQLMQPGEAVFEEVVRQFGTGILEPDGRINRQKLADAAFGSSQQNPPRQSRIEELNRIVHPAVTRRQEEWMEEMGRQDPQAIAIVEAALILEAGQAKRFDRLVVVTCPLEVRVQRWARRTGGDEAAARKELERRRAAQLPDEEKVRAADYVIDNSGTMAETELRTQAVFVELRREAESSEP